MLRPLAAEHLKGKTVQIDVSLGLGRRRVGDDLDLRPERRVRPDQRRVPDMTIRDVRDRSMSTIAPAKDFLSILDLSTRRPRPAARRWPHESSRSAASDTTRRPRTPSRAPMWRCCSKSRRCARGRRSRSPSASSAVKPLHLSGEFADGSREPLEDVARNLERWVKALVVRTFAHDKARTLASAGARLHVINALSDAGAPVPGARGHDHGARALGRLPGTHAGVRRRRQQRRDVARRTRRRSSESRFMWPRLTGYELPARVIEAGMRGARGGARVRTFTDAREAVVGADAVYTDVWTSMGQESEAAKRRRMFEPFQVNGAAHGGGGAAGALHALPARPSRRRGHRRGVRIARVGRLRPGRKPPAYAEGAAADAAS